MSAPEHLRVLFLAPQPFFEVRGTPLAVLSMVRALSSLGHRVDLLTFAQGSPVDVPGLRHRRSLALPVGRVRPGASLAKLILDVPFMAKAAWLMATGRYQVVHAVEEAAHLAAPICRLLRLPLVMDVDSAILDQLRESGFARRGPLLWLVAALEGHALRYASAVVTVCQSLTDNVRARMPTARVFQIEDPPLLEPGALPAAQEAAGLRRSLGLGTGPVVLYSGNFEPYQGVALLVEAAGRLGEARFLFMGGEPAEIAAMKALADRIGAGDRCVFTGKRPPSDLPLFLAACDVVASPRCLGVNTPFKIYSYLASGKPLVATRIFTHTQLLDDSLAVLVPPTAEGLANGIATVLADPVAASALARRGLDLIEREYSTTRHAQKVAVAYREIAALVK